MFPASIYVPQPHHAQTCTHSEGRACAARSAAICCRAAGMYCSRPLLVSSLGCASLPGAGCWRMSRTDSVESAAPARSPIACCTAATLLAASSGACTGQTAMSPSVVRCDSCAASHHMLKRAAAVKHTIPGERHPVVLGPCRSCSAVTCHQSQSTHTVAASSPTGRPEPHLPPQRPCSLPDSSPPCGADCLRSRSQPSHRNCVLFPEMAPQILLALVPGPHNASRPTHHGNKTLS